MEGMGGNADMGGFGFVISGWRAMVGGGAGGLERGGVRGGGECGTGFAGIAATGGAASGLCGGGTFCISSGEISN